MWKLKQVDAHRVNFDSWRHRESLNKSKVLNALWPKHCKTERLEIYSTGNRCLTTQTKYKWVISELGRRAKVFFRALLIGKCICILRKCLALPIEIEQLIDGIKDGLSVCLADCKADTLTDWLFDWLKKWLTDLLMMKTFDWLKEHSAWLIYQLIDWPIDWLYSQLIDC